MCGEQSVWGTTEHNERGCLKPQAGLHSTKDLTRIGRIDADFLDQVRPYPLVPRSKRSQSGATWSSWSSRFTLRGAHLRRKLEWNERAVFARGGTLLYSRVSASRSPTQSRGLWYYTFTFRSRSAFPITDTELNVIAALAIIGDRSMPKNG